MTHWPAVARLIWLGPDPAPEHPGGVYCLDFVGLERMLEQGLSDELRRLRSEGCVVATGARASAHERGLMRELRGRLRVDGSARLATLARELGLCALAGQLDALAHDLPERAWQPIQAHEWLTLISMRQADERLNLEDERNRHLLLATSKL